MQRNNLFLRTKLLPPRAVSDLLERPRLIEKLQANLNSPITMVAADAGCGKTTLVADFLRGLGRPSVWYQLDHTDADPFVFLGYITEGIRTVVPGFGEAINEYLAEAGEELVRVPERAVDLLLNEILDALERPMVLVLDDYHHIGRDTIVHKMLDRLLHYSTDMLHVIMTTRDLPPLAIVKRRTQASATIIRREDLLFTDDEVRALFKATLGVDLRDEEIETYRARTHGWITALQLVRQIAEQEMHGGVAGDRPDLRDVLSRTEKDIFDYFVEEVFAREPEETQKLLLEMSLLDSLPLDDCSRLYPDIRCSALLPALAQKNIFLTAAGDAASGEVYRFHPLFRDFLLRRQRSEIGQKRLNEERRRIAEFYLERGQWETAMSYLLASESYDRAAEIIAEQGGASIAGGAFLSVGMFADRVPAASLEKFPRSLLYTAEIARLQGEREKAAARLARAVELLHKNKDAAGEAEALHSQASLARRRRNCPEAFVLLEKAEKLAAENSETLLKCANTRGLCLILEGDWAEAERQFRFALELAEKQGNEHYVRLITHNLALAPGFRGDFGEALRWFKRIFRDDQPGKQLPQEAIGHLNVARLHLYRGEFEDTERHLERSLELCQLYNLKFLLGEILEAYGNLYRQRGDAAHAEEFYERATKAYDDAEVDISTRELEEERALFNLRRGNFASARGILEKLITAREANGNQTGILTARSLLARVSLAEGKLDGLVTELDELLTFFRENFHYYEEALASLCLAETHFALGQRAESVEALQRVLDLSARFDYDHWLREEMRRASDVFRQEEIAERLPQDLRRELEMPAERPAVVEPVEEAAVGPVTDLTISVLGPVEIYRDRSKPFAADAWTTRRARDIFCFIATSKHRRAAKDVVIDTFWPDEEFAAIEKNFHPTISHIRKALNSQQAFKQNFLMFRDGAYQLNPDLSYSIDCEEFERCVVDAENAKRDKDNAALRANLERARELYRGEFMSGVYEDWAEERRTYYEEQHMRVLAAAARLDFSEKKWTGALKIANEILSSDPYREDMHRLIMKIYAVQGKAAALKEQYESLRTMLQKDLGIQPANETRRVYAELIK